MGRSALTAAARERAMLLTRLACIALASTLVLLAGTGVLSLAAAILLLYLGATVLLRYWDRARDTDVVGSAIDLLAITTLVYAFPLTVAPWVLYAFAIGIAALRYGAVGAVTATAVAVVGFDAALAIRTGEARAADLWAVQALIAIGLVIAELVWALGREDPDVLGGRARALGALAHVRDPDELVRATCAEVARIDGVRGAWVWTRGPDHRLRIVVSSGAAPSDETVVSAETLRRLEGPLALDHVLPDLRGIVVPLASDPPLSVAADVDGASAELATTATAAVADLAGDAAPLVAGAFERTQLAEDGTALVALASAITAVTSEQTLAGSFATIVMESGRLVDGEAAVVRIADGHRIAGDVDGMTVAGVARDRRLPAIVALNGQSAALVPLGEGRVLAVTADRERLAARLSHLERLALAARARLGLLAERDAFERTASELGRDVESLGGALRAREDALATAVHELRNPLTAVHGYATLMSRNLNAVQGQLTQLERLMADLLRAEGLADTGERVADVVSEARDAIARARVRSSADVALEAPDDPVRVAIEPSRLAQVFDNLLANAAKYSRPGDAIVVAVGREGDSGLVRVTDRGIGIEPEHLERVFDRFYRVPGATTQAAGQGLGLSITKEIVTANGGRIWAESAGAGQGSTFSFTLPLAPERTPAV